MSKLEIIYKDPRDLKPYANNARINDHAVDDVATSIEQFGFQQPIVVDPDFVIIAGHTRWKAATKLHDFSVDYMLGMCYAYHVKPIEVREAPKSKNARYIGLRLKKGEL